MSWGVRSSSNPDFNCGTDGSANQCARSIEPTLNGPQCEAPGTAAVRVSACRSNADDTVGTGRPSSTRTSRASGARAGNTTRDGPGPASIGAAAAGRNSGCAASVRVIRAARGTSGTTRGGSGPASIGAAAAGRSGGSAAGVRVVRAARGTSGTTRGGSGPASTGAAAADRSSRPCDTLSGSAASSADCRSHAVVSDIKCAPATTGNRQSNRHQPPHQSIPIHPKRLRFPRKQRTKRARLHVVPSRLYHICPRVVADRWWVGRGHILCFEQHAHVGCMTQRPAVASHASLTGISRDLFELDLNLLWVRPRWYAKGRG